VQNGVLPIGKPIPNCNIYILGKTNTIQPIGVSGELCIGGDGLAKGYLNNLELTKEKFIDHPFSQGEKLYRTGDLARWLPDGNIEFLGRIDHQVKLRGFRIELGEIESALLKHERIKESVVVAREANGDKCLCAYVVCEGEIDKVELRAHLSASLPDYMIPSYYVALENLPLSSNGKVDRKALPSPEYKAGSDYVAPSNNVEEQLAQIWSEVLNAPKEEISVTANFFSMGGHSLKATVLTGRIHRELGVEFPLREVFIHSTIQAQAIQIGARDKRLFVSIPKAKKQEYYPLTSAQRRLYLLQQMDLGSTTYNMPGLLRAPKGQSRQQVEELFRQLIQRHDSFRTSFEVVDEMPVQRIHGSIPFSVREYRIGREELPRVSEEFVQPFDLGRAPLLRVGYLEVLGGENLLLVDMHHTIGDGRSYTILSEEFKQLTEGNTLPPLALQYKDYSEWQNSPEQQHRIKSQERYWLERLIGELPVLSLPTDYARPRMQEFEGARVAFSLTSEETQALRDTCNDQGLTLYMSLLSIFTILLSRLSGQEDIIVGSPVAARRHTDLEGIVGMFVNTLALRNGVKGVSRLTDFLQEVKASTIEAYEHQEYQFEDLVEKLSVERDTSRNPIFDVMFNLLEEPPGEGAEPSGERFMHVPAVSKFDLSLTALDFGTALQLSVEYSTRLFRPESIERYIGYLRRIIAGVSAGTDRPISEVDMLSTEEKRQLLYAFNDTKADYPKDKTIHQLFEEQVERTPDSIALVFEDSRMTFFELNAKSNQLGRVLRGKGVIPDGIVGLLVDRGIETIIGALGILKAGGAYLPIDIDYPDARIDYILENSNSDTVVTIRSKKQRVSDDKNVIYVEDSNLDSDDCSNLVRVNNTADLAYIIYTSGTTGKPKGVMIEHRNVVRLMFNDKFQFDFNSKDVWTMFHSHSFDFSVWEMYGSLLYGGKLVIIPKMIARSPSYYIQILRNECVTILNQTPSVFYGLADEELQFNNSALSLRNVIFGGEALTPNKLTRWREKYPNVKLINMFGITETTVHVTFKEIGNHEIEESVSNIGKPIPTLATYILDSNRKLVPVGVSGELCVGGLGVSRGYLNNPELTAERFIQNPYKPEERLYCSGDLARIFPDGDMEHLGRIDHQVQLRGFRIELGEIESALLGHERIKESVVIDREADGDKYLCAYVVSEGEIDRDELCTYLSGRLPDYMIPSYYVQLEQLPLTSNGKIDRRSLPSPEYKAGSGYEAPSNAIESTLARIWSEVLNLPQEEISVTANFFSMGGHSLKATVLTGRIHRELGVEFPLREVFTCPTIRSQASRIAASENTGFISIPKAKRQDYYPLSSAQKRMYLLQQMDLGSTAYNMPMIIRLSADADFDRITLIFNRLIARHESFRTSFELKDELPIQRIHSDVVFEIKVQTIEERDLEKRRTDFIHPFDLFHAPLLRAELLHIKAGDPVLLIDMHHIISDGESHGILVEEFNRLISGQDLPPLRMQYKDYSEWQNSKEHQESIQHQESYWIEKFTDELPVLTLPTDYPRPVVQDINGSSVSFLLSADETAIILDICKEQSLTLYMAMLSVFTILLSKLSGQEDIIVGSPIAARHHADLEGVVGIFVNTLAIRSDVSGHKRLADYLQEFKGKMIEVYENQDYQFEDLVEKVALDRDPSRNPIFDVMFNLQNRKESLGDLLNLFPNEYAHEKGVSKFDLSFIVKDFDQQLLVTIEYCTALFKPDTIDRFVQYFKHLVRQLPTGLSNQLHEIEILPPEEKDQILKKFNATEKNYPVTHVSHELFEQIAYQFPDRTAVVLDELHLTFSTLNQYANKVAKTLISSGVQNNRMIAVIADRSLEMIINMIGVIKSGGAYLPLDIDYPIERLKEQLQDSGVEIILSSKNLIDGTIFNRDVLCVDYFNTSESDEDPKVNVSPNDLAYLIYTSGSTGVPKGVEVEHMSLVNMVLSLKERYRIGKNERILQFSSPSFDVSVEQIWLSLLSGSTLVLIRQELLHNIDKFESYVEAKGVTHLNVVPTYLSYLNADRKRNVRRVIVGGESLSVDLLKPWVRQSDFYNVYGTTETTVTCTSKYYQKGEELINKVSIGQPIDNSTVYIFDEHLHLLPIGVFGELFIGGSSLARGYHNKESLTNERFISNPYKPEERLYKTGDRVRWVGSGDIEFLDRIDDQVKVRGYRIELGEVEVNILRHSNVKEVAVATRKDEQGNNYLCAYYVSKTQAKNLAESIKDYLSGILPHYMVPSYFIEMDELPLTPSGKINRKGLPSPKINLHDGYIAPSNKVEETLVKIWSEVLNILPEEISVNASFFMLGGHSLKATVLVSRIHRELDVKLGLKEIFLHQTIEAMAALINTSNNKAFIAIPKAEKKLYYKLSSAQKRLFFIQQLNPDNLAYNMPMLIEIPNEIGIAQVEEVCKVLISRHENFRTSYHIVNGEAVQRIYSELPFSVNECRIKEDELEGINEELIKPFNLGQAPLLRVFYLHVENKGPVLFFDMHHIISDGASLKILEKEFYQLLAGEKLHPISLQYKDYSEWQSNYEKQNVIKKQEEYWLDMFRGDLPVLNLPTDFPRKALQDFKGYAVEFILSKEETENVKMLSRKSDSTLYMTLLSVLAILLSKLCGQKDIVIGTPVFGRQHNDLEKIVGMFINILAIRYEVKNVKSLLEFVNDVKQNTIEAFDNQDYQFDDLVDKVLKERSLSRNPFFDVLFNLLNYKNFSGDLSQLNQEKGHQGLEASKLDLTLTAVDYGEQLFFSFKYSTSLFKEETIIQFVEYFRGIINQIPSKLNAPVSEIDLVDHKNEEDLENCLNMSLDRPGN
jgi:amino acid adenylation domain-containing protein